MVKFLVNRPIAVIMTLIALLTVGVITLNLLPVSLLPNVDVPEITIMLNYKNTEARELENAIVRPLRTQLLQITNLKDIKSDTRDGSSVIKLYFDYGITIDLAFLETNEKIDAAVSFLPRDMDRPRVIKASASDIPVFYLNVLPKENQSIKSDNLLEESKLCENILRRQLEELSDVAMVDMTGLDQPELVIIPMEEAMHTNGITYEQLEQVLKQNNIEPGNIIVNSGHYRYNLKLTSLLRTTEDVKQIFFKFDNRIIQLKDIAKVEMTYARREGMFYSGQRQGISMAIIKQANARMDKLKEQVAKIIEDLKIKYPSLDFELSRDQSFLLNYSIENMKQNLLMGIILGFIVLFLFLGDFRSSLLIGITMPLVLVASVFFLYLAGISINLLSLSGLILAVGMMVDNSIIVIDNIWFHKHSGMNYTQAAISGTNNVIAPMLSSVLTTCAVFIPLVFMSGLAGTLFYDQAVAVTIGLMVSFFLAIIVIPVFYNLFNKNRKNEAKKNTTLKFLLVLYNMGYHFTFKRKTLLLILFFLLLPLGYIMYLIIPKQIMPEIKQTEMTVKIDWNDNITSKENADRCLFLINENKHLFKYSNIYIGKQQFMLNREQDMAANEALLFLSVNQYDQIDTLKQNVLQWFSNVYPQANFRFERAKNIFEQLFVSEEEAPLVANIQPESGYKKTEVGEINQIINKMKKIPGSESLSDIPENPIYECRVLFDKLLLYEVEYYNLLKTLQSAFDENRIDYLHTGNKYIPIKLGRDLSELYEILNELQVKGKDQNYYPVSQLVSIYNRNDFKSIIANSSGEIIPLPFNVNSDNVEETRKEIKKILADYNDYTVTFSGSLASGKKMLGELSIILLISIMLLYFILAAQFESLLLPLIVLIEIPFDIAAAFFFLYLFGYSLNIMSAIGIIVMSGIIINDSILKIDTINNLYRKEGMSILEAIHEGGTRKLNAILMTSLTTILAMVPLLFTKGLGSELQAPLAVSLFGGMVVGTLVSLFFIPLIYWLINKKKADKIEATAT